LCALEELVLIEFQIILVDDGSDKIKSSNLENFKVSFLNIKLEKSIGISGAILQGTRHALFEDILIIPGHNMYDSKAIINVLSLLGTGRIILGARNNLDHERPFFKRVASRVMRDLYRHFFYYYVGDIHGLAIYKKHDIENFLKCDDGHAQGVIIVTKVLNQGGLLVQTLAPIKQGHKVARSYNIRNNFPSLKQVSKIIRVIILLKRQAPNT